ncbi:hypothetical protein OHA72_22515 [Dactylosporangium sp. NBC_01737]|uniref:hypothetical protein n=1 Tax=Dactylosporangium sp. NBC_01737 TaxID=2975959 RepID=UPI002E0DB118|nr:hypothetical protein OHA72_22515 [Dactylosporangium sp. NBC_01737]
MLPLAVQLAEAHLAVHDDLADDRLPVVTDQACARVRWRSSSPTATGRLDRGAIWQHLSATYSLIARLRACVRA